ncbi:MAG TPA: hypothetical protein VFD45_03430 [Patescibacteria group bacterium]|nr:hypothetical protein [Patescibacteria group bacterium]
MNGLFKNTFNDRTTKRGFFFCIIIIVLSIIYVAFYYRFLPPLIPLFNQLPWGEQRLSKTIGIFIPPLIAFIIFLINLILASRFYAKAPLLSRMLAITSFLISILTFLFIIRTVQAVL